MTIVRRLQKTDGSGRFRFLTGLIALLAIASVGATGCGSGTGPSDAKGDRTAGPASAASSSAGTPASPKVRPTPSPTAPVAVHRTVRKRAEIPFPTRTLDSVQLKKGVTRVKQAGRVGVRISVYRVTVENGVVSSRRLVRKLVTRRPVARIKLRGTRVPAPKPSPPPNTGANCDSNYSGGCVPIASDVDCGGGSGDGPAYVYGPVRVAGADVYGLDADGDGYGCD